MALGDKTTIEIKDGDWSMYNNTAKCPAAVAIKAYFSTPYVFVSPLRSEHKYSEEFRIFPEHNCIAGAVMGGEVVTWSIEGLVRNQDCTIILTEIERYVPTEKALEKFLKAYAEF